jgi:AAA15 family ATPase/GTPase
MLIEFSVKNYRSIKDLQTLSFVAAPIKSKYPELDTNNVIKVSDKLSLLKSVAIYGANGSGKSNLVKALISMMFFIRDSFKDDQIGKRIIEPFELNLELAEQPTFFQLIFIINHVRYRYGFEIFQNEVRSEWLYGTPGKSETYYFTRIGSTIKLNDKKFTDGIGLENKTSNNNLFLNITKAFNGKISKQIIDFFEQKVAISAGVNDEGFRESTIIFINNIVFKKQIVDLLNHADIGIQDINHKKMTLDDLPENPHPSIIRDFRKGKLDIILSTRQLFDAKGEKIGVHLFDFDGQESDGTKKFFNYSGAILDALVRGGALILDEFDARLHPMLTKKIVELFNSPTVNKNGAQLVFVTHDTNLLDNSLLRRDQIYFTEKNKLQETELYSLADFKGIRNDASYEKDYINGKYGAIPFLGDFEELFEV